MSRKALTTCFFVLLMAGITLSVAAEEPTVYEEISHHYEAVRQALLVDSITGVAEHAAAIRHGVDVLAEDFHAEQAGVAADQAEECKKLLPEIAAAAQQVADGTSLDETRTAFFELSKPLGRYRKLTGDLDSKVMFCPMAKKAWIQPDDEIGNPYLGTEMPDCGQVIADVGMRAQIPGSRMGTHRS